MEISGIMSSCKYHNCQINIITHSPAYKCLSLLKVLTAFSVFHLRWLLACMASEPIDYETETAFFLFFHREYIKELI